MRRTLSTEFWFQVFSLIIATIVIHAFYVMTVRPNAEAVLAEQALRMEQEENYSPPQSIWVIIKDYEQESEVILMIWALAILIYKSRGLLRERALLQQELLPVREGVRILPEDSRVLQGLPPAIAGMLLPRVLLAALERFGATRNVQDVSSMVNTLCESESGRLDTELGMIRYIAWAIPSIGFIGTVRGIGMALNEAHRAVEGDILGVTENLGVAFNSTLVALLLSIVLMFFVHQLQLIQERLVLDSQTYVDHNLIRHMQARGGS
jgi:biopolymer transport protein ExbB/TolQ